MGVCGSNEKGPHRLLCLNAWSPLVELVGKDWEVWTRWRSCVTVEGHRGFKGPGQAQCLSFSLPTD